MRRAWIAAILAATLSCGSLRDLEPEEEITFPVGDEKGDGVGSATGTVTRVSSAAQLERFRTPQPGSYQIHNIDVGTGLSVLVRGSSFNLLFDGGSGDDRTGISADRQHNRNRLVAYLFAALGPSGPADCTPDGDGYARADRPLVKIDHVVLSHSHDDHVSLLPDVVHCYDVRNVWEPGAVATTSIYNKFIRSLPERSSLVYHTAAPPSADNRIHFVDRTTQPPTERFAPVYLPNWVQFHEYADDNYVQKLNYLGTSRPATAFFRILHADGSPHSDANDNSVVLRVDLGPTKLLLVGDAESGERKPPGAAVDGVEEHLLTLYPDLIDVDIHQAGHHGSLTSNRDRFLRAVSPRLVLIGAGPKKYGSVVLPDSAVVTEYDAVVPRLPNDRPNPLSEAAAAQPAERPADATARLGQVIERSVNHAILRTDQNDVYRFSLATPLDGLPRLVADYKMTGCLGDRIGVDDPLAGGCDNYVVALPRMGAGPTSDE